jgi:hypothetical protein
MLAGVRVRADRDEQRRVLGHREVGAAARHGGDLQRITRDGRGQSDDIDGGLQRNHGGDAVQAQCLDIAVYGAERDGQVAIAAGRHSHRGRAVEGKTDAGAREADAGRDVDGVAVQCDAQTPGDAAQAERAAYVEDRLAQAILHVLQMIRGDAESIEELGAGIISHERLG